MSTILDLRHLRSPLRSRAFLLASSLVVVSGLAIVAAGWHLYHGMTNNTLVVYFTQANALYSGDRVQIMGLEVGAVDKVEPAGDKMRVTLHYASRYKVPAGASAVILNPSLVASRTIELVPAYDGGPVLSNNAVIPVERTRVPVEWDDLRNQLTNMVDKLGPTPEQPKGPFGEVIESLADGLAGKGQELNTTLDDLSRAAGTLNAGRGDFFAVLRSLATFVNALHKDDRQFVALNENLAQFMSSLTNSDQIAANAIKETDSVLSTARPFLMQNRGMLTRDINNFDEVTTAILQPSPREGLETALHVVPTLGSNILNLYRPAQGGLAGLMAFAYFANPLMFVCSLIQAGSRLGYQDSAELCAQYLTPVMDAIKVNYLPFGLNLFSTGDLLPKNIAYSEQRLHPPPGYKDTTVPGIFSPDTPWSHRNFNPGWIAAPGMQGTQVSTGTASMLTPESLAELMGGPDAPPPPPGTNMPGPPNAYDENNPLPPPWYPPPLPSPTPAAQVSLVPGGGQ